MDEPLAIWFDRSEFLEQKTSAIRIQILPMKSMYKFLMDLRQSLNNGESSRMNQ